jgi:hypothetical protein
MMGAMKGEGQLINLMHCRYTDALRDLVTMIGGDTETIKKHVEIANKLSTMNVDKYCIDWGQKPNPQKIIVLEPDGNILSTEFYLPLKD